QTLTNNLRISQVLPTSRSSRQSYSPTFHISNNPFNIRFSTNALNSFFVSLVKRMPNVWKIWFSIGVLVGIVTFFFGIGIMVVASWKLLIGILELLGLSWTGEAENISSNIINKRSFEEHVRHDVNDENNQVFIPV
ncbi:7622_t:CDS:1, partial [Racocetra persica]